MNREPRQLQLELKGNLEAIRARVRPKSFVLFRAFGPRNIAIKRFYNAHWEIDQGGSGVDRSGNGGLDINTVNTDARHSYGPISLKTNLGRD